jgi:hypothetical protein
MNDSDPPGEFVLAQPIENISALNTAAFFEERREKADHKQFRRILNRKGGEPPKAGDEL